MFQTILKLFISLVLCLLSAAVSADVLIKIATVAPKDSVWHLYLKKVDQRWQQLSEGEVRLKIYAGTLGDEDDIMRRVRIGQLDAATLSTAGLSSIDQATKAMHIPLAFASNEEMEFVQKRISKKLDAVLQQKGFKALAWGEVGWVHFFTKEPVRTPDDLKKLKLFTWSANATTEEKIWHELGFQTLSLSSVDIMPALQTGMISAFQAPPLVALANQWFPFTPYMTDLKWAPLTGATIISDKAWGKIPSEFRERMVEIVHEENVVLQQQVRDLEKQAKSAMQKRGLKIVTVSDADFQRWHEAVAKVYPEIRSTVIPESYFDEVLRLRDEYRQAAEPQMLIRR